jgi:hypothetical protein
VIGVNKLPGSSNRSAPPQLTSTCTGITRTCASRAHSNNEEGRLKNPDGLSCAHRDRGASSPPSSAAGTGRRSRSRSCSKHWYSMYSDTVPTPCQPHANPMPTPYQPHANPMPTPSQTHANPMPTPCDPIRRGFPPGPLLLPAASSSSQLPAAGSPKPHNPGGSELRAGLGPFFWLWALGFLAWLGFWVIGCVVIQIALYDMRYASGREDTEC